MRASVSETLEQGYIVTARQKGLSRREIIMGHVVRNSILPVITVMGYSFGTAMGGAVLLETVFSYRRRLVDGRVGARTRYAGDRGRRHPGRLFGGRDERRGRS